MSATLRSLGFEVVEGEDLSKAGMDEKVQDFADKVNDADVALFFYAGHGMQVAGRNYLVPIDAKLERATSVDFETVDADRVLGYMSADKRVAIALLDACRDNPLARTFARSLGASRSAAVGRGLAVPSTPGGGLLIGFATAPGDVALDGEGKNSPVHHRADPASAGQGPRDRAGSQAGQGGRDQGNRQSAAALGQLGRRRRPLSQSVNTESRRQSLSTF